MPKSKEPPERIFLGFIVGFGLIFYYLAIGLWKAVHAIVWRVPDKQTKKRGRYGNQDNDQAQDEAKGKPARRKTKPRAKATKVQA